MQSVTLANQQRGADPQPVMMKSEAVRLAVWTPTRVIESVGDRWITAFPETSLIAACNASAAAVPQPGPTRVTVIPRDSDHARKLRLVI
jgi:hypothetical protein